MRKKAFLCPVCKKYSLTSKLVINQGKRIPVCKPCGVGYENTYEEDKAMIIVNLYEDKGKTTTIDSDSDENIVETFKKFQPNSNQVLALFNTKTQKLEFVSHQDYEDCLRRIHGGN